MRGCEFDRLVVAGPPGLAAANADAEVVTSEAGIGALVGYEEGFGGGGSGLLDNPLPAILSLHSFLSFLSRSFLSGEDVVLILYCPSPCCNDEGGGAELVLMLLLELRLLEFEFGGGIRKGEVDELSTSGKV